MDTEIKFLGFYFARRGEFQKHIEYLRKKAFNKLNTLKARADKRYGARTQHLPTLAFSSIRSGIEYGAAVLNSACASLLKKPALSEFLWVS